MDPLSFHPPLKPQPPPPSPSSSITSFPILAISIIGILTTFILLFSYYVFVIKCCLNWHHSYVVGGFFRPRHRRRHDSFIVFSTPAGNHGLDESTIQAIPTFRYRKRSDGTEGRCFHECAVCLNELQEQERIRLLPNCFHVFHIDCIDTWLQTNANCPVCRSNITTSIPVPADHLMALPPHHHPYQTNDAVIEVRDSDGSDHTQTVTATNACSSPSKQKKERKLQHLSSMGDECIDVRHHKDGQFCVQPIRRSFSLDSSSDRQLYMVLQKILQQNSHFQNVRAESSSSSGRIRRSIFSFGRSSRGAVLPPN